MAREQQGLDLDGPVNLGAQSGGRERQAGEQRYQLEFSGDASEYFRIWIVNVGLTILTLGIYSAWAKVRKKNWFYRNTMLDKSAFEYTADPIKILKGRLIVGTFLIAMSVSEKFSMGLYAALLIIFFLCTPALVVLSLAFNARNSEWRNVRFSFQGRFAEAYALLLLTPFVYLFTLGAGIPWLQWRFSKFVIGRHLYGVERFELHTKSSAFYRVYFKALLLIIGAGVAGWLITKSISAVSGQSDGAVGLLVLLGSFYLAVIPISGFIRAGISNATFNGVSIGAHRLESDQSGLALAGLYVTNLLAILFSLGLAIPWAEVRMARYRAEHLRLIADGPLVSEDLELAEKGNALGEAGVDLGDIGFDVGL